MAYVLERAALQGLQMVSLQQRLQLGIYLLHCMAVQIILGEKQLYLLLGDSEIIGALEQFRHKITDELYLHSRRTFPF